jgi:hypothetical protein
MSPITPFEKASAKAINPHACSATVVALLHSEGHRTALLSFTPFHLLLLLSFRITTEDFTIYRGSHSLLNAGLEEVHRLLELVHPMDRLAYVEHLCRHLHQSSGFGNVTRLQANLSL